MDEEELRSALSVVFCCAELLAEREDSDGEIGRALRKAAEAIWQEAGKELGARQARPQTSPPSAALSRSSIRGRT